MKETFHKKMLSFTLMAVLAASTSTFAQEPESKEPDKPDGITVGVRGGIHLMSMGPLDLSFGWHVGAVHDVLQIADMDVFGKLYLQPGILFSAQNSIYDEKTYWLEVPVLLSWKYTLFKGTFFEGTYRTSIGPYATFGLIGDFEDKVESLFVDESSSMNRFDAGLSIGHGREYQWFWIGVSMNMGFMSVSEYYDYTAWSYKITLGVNI